MKRFSVISSFLLIFVASSLFCSCSIEKEGKTDTSHFSQLTGRDYPCADWPAARMSHARNLLPNGLLRGWKEDDSLKHALNALAGVPDDYLVWMGTLTKEYDFHISPSSGSSGGVALYPSYIYVSDDPSTIDLALQHEVGHIVQHRIDELTNDFDYPQNFYDSADENYDNPQLNAYPRSYGRHQDVYYKEYWAEAFNSFYCSQDTNSMLEKWFPSTYVILKQNLLPPIW